MNTAESTPGTELPLIDLGPLIRGEPDGLAQVAREIGRACRTVGFFYVRNHGLRRDLLGSLYTMSRRFFALPQTEKDALAINGQNRGYVGFGSESLDPQKLADAKEAFNIGRAPQHGEAADSVGTNQWPELSDFRELLTHYYQQMQHLSEQIHTAIAVDLGLTPDYFQGFVDRPMATLRLLHYPPHPDPFDGTRYGAGAHTDYGNLTILWQDEVGGLEVRARDGRWLAAPPIADSFVCNIGDCLMRWSNDIYISNPHRVTNRSGRERYSAAFFFDPNPDAWVECLPSCTRDDRPPRYPPITAAQHLRERLDATYVHRRREPGDDPRD